MRVSDNLRYMTVRILTSPQNNTNWTGTGTGFLYFFEKDGRQAPLVITNKHVLANALAAGLTFHVTEDNNNSAISGPGRLISFSIDDVPIIYHPDPNVDLAGIALSPLIHHAINNEGWHPYIKCLNVTNLPTPQMISDFGAIEDIIMVGYPVGIGDHVNNYPVVRRGITSTPYSTNYQGKNEFLADIPVFGGSSGSPVCIVNEGGYSTPNSFVMGGRFSLIGVLYAGHTETINGQIVAEPVPTSIRPTARIKHMINLGLCIKSSLIEELSSKIADF